ncbi:hypothetical protein GXW82_43300 [Streptacidiphilus sp. 4-A2]|nr:hypothetical protein [Streptacidiphilus sp. 4-A2]
MIEANTVLSAERLVTAVGRGSTDRSPRVTAQPPRAAARQLGPEAAARLRTVAPGYLIEVHDGELDEHDFHSLCRRGRSALQAADWAAASEALTAALALWRGEPAGDTLCLNGPDQRIGSLLETHAQALEDRIEADLHLGRHHDVLAELSSLTAAHPAGDLPPAADARPVPRRQTGRGARRLPESAPDTRRRAGCGAVPVRPTAALPHPQRRPHALGPAISVCGPGRGRVAPVPVPGGAFQRAGRPSCRGSRKGNRRVKARRTAADGRRTAAGGRCRIQRKTRPAPGVDGGSAGLGQLRRTGPRRRGHRWRRLGKTALAVHAAHRIARHFPDGQFYADFRGTDRVPRDPHDILGGWLRALRQAVDPADDPEERAAQWRSALYSKGVLLLLDNVRDAEQIRPLLPATPACAVIVTSRARLADLPAHAYSPWDR